MDKFKDIHISGNCFVNKVNLMTFIRHLELRIKELETKLQQYHQK